MKSLLPVLQAIGSDKKDIDLNEMEADLFQFSLDSGLASYLIYTSRKDITSNYLSILKAADLTAKIISKTQLDALNELLSMVSTEINEIILLKGIVICQTYYPSPHFRIMSDIDILVGLKSSSTVEAALLNLGYVQTSDNSIEFYRTHHHSIPFYNVKNNVWFEVHTHLFSGDSPALNDPIFEIPNIFKNCVSIDNKNYSENIFQLTTEIQIIYSCAHFAEDIKINKSCLQLVDIILLIKNRGNGVDWNRLFIMINNTASASYVYLILSYFNKHKIVNIPDNMNKVFTLKNSNMGVLNIIILHLIIDNYLLGKKTTNRFMSEGNISIIWNTLLSPSSSLCNILLLPWNLIFPAENIDRYKFSLIVKRIKSFLKNDG